MNLKEFLQIKWHHKFSYWIFIWFILYKIKIVSYSPSFAYIFSIIMIICFIIIISIKSIANKTTKINKTIVFIRILILCFIDIIPLILLYPFRLNYKTLIVNIIVLLLYLIYMNQSIIDTFNMYIIYNSNYINKMTLNQYIKYLKNFYTI